MFGNRRRSYVRGGLPGLMAFAVALAVPGVVATTALASTAGAAQDVGATATNLPCNTTALRAAVRLPHVSVSSAVDEASGSFTPPGTATPITGLPDFCQVSLVQIDPAGNPVNIVVWLPANWNGNFQGVGGAGYSCGITTRRPGIAGSLHEGVESGYATASTDCGVPISDGATGSWALKPDGDAELAADPGLRLGGDARHVGGGQGGHRGLLHARLGLFLLLRLLDRRP